MELKYLGIIAIFFLVLGAVSANDLALVNLDGIDYFDRVTIVNLGDFDFTIPAGFAPLTEGSIHIDDNGVKKDSEFFVNENDDAMAICVFSGNVDTNLENYGPEDGQKENRTLNGHDGILSSPFGYSHKFFVYNDNGSVILVQAPTVRDIESIIPK